MKYLNLTFLQNILEDESNGVHNDEPINEEKPHAEVPKEHQNKIGKT